MKARNFYTKVFTFKKIQFPFFIAIIALQIFMAVLSMIGEQHWIIFADAVASLGLVVAIFLCNYFKKIKAAKILTTFLFFSQAVFLTAYSFQPFPKAPDAASGMVAFIIYIFYALSFLTLTILAIIKHTNLSNNANDKTMFGMYITYTIQIALSLILIIGTIINLGMAGYSHMLMVDLVNYLAYGLINYYLLSLETEIQQNSNSEK